jgi:DNA-directed RNA polymerase alpha subunit
LISMVAAAGAVLQLSVSALGLSVRAESALARASIRTIGELLALSSRKVTGRGVSTRSLDEIQSALSLLGLRLWET